jgi:threonine synthase
LGLNLLLVVQLLEQKKLVDKGIISPDEHVVGILTGNILKDPDAVVGYHKDTLGNMGIKGSFANKPQAVEANLDAVKKILENLI